MTGLGARATSQSGIAIARAAVVTVAIGRRDAREFVGRDPLTRPPLGQELGVDPGGRAEKKGLWQSVFTVDSLQSIICMRQRGTSVLGQPDRSSGAGKGDRMDSGMLLTVDTPML
jgi:hypothetical protein